MEVCPRVPEVSTLTFWKPIPSRSGTVLSSGINTRIHTGHLVSLSTRANDQYSLNSMTNFREVSYQGLLIRIRTIYVDLSNKLNSSCVYIYRRIYIYQVKPR